MFILEPASPSITTASKWNGGSGGGSSNTTGGFKSFQNNSNNDENASPNGNGGFGARSSGFGGNYFQADFYTMIRI